MEFGRRTFLKGFVGALTGLVGAKSVEAKIVEPKPLIIPNGTPTTPKYSYGTDDNVRLHFDATYAPDFIVQADMMEDDLDGIMKVLKDDLAKSKTGRLSELL